MVHTLWSVFLSFKFLLVLGFSFSSPFSLPFPLPLSPFPSLSLAVYLLTKTDYFVLQGFPQFGGVNSTLKVWVYTFGIPFSLELCLAFTILIKRVKLGHLLEDLGQRSKTSAQVPHMAHRPRFKINCIQLNIVKFPIKIKISIPFSFVLFF